LSNRNWIYTEFYSSLYDKWKNERSSELIQPLEFNFYTQTWDELKNLDISIMNGKIIEEAIKERVKFFLESLKMLRWNKINSYLLRNLHIDSSLLTSQEIDAFNIILDLFTWYNELPIQTEGKFLNFSKNAFTINNTNKTSSIPNLTKENGFVNEKKIKVKFLKKIDKFILPNLETLGPFSINEIVNIPKRVVDEILLPQQIVELI
jgi:hypothetical protein